VKRVCRFAIRAACVAALLLGIVWNLRFGTADVLARRNQANDTRSAMRLMPGNGAYPAQLADETYASDPAAAKSLLDRAVSLNRYDAASWIQLALLYEAGNDLPAAERALLQAASVDTTFLPSWSLANFYFRRENVARFWYWAQRAAQMAPDDATPLFRLAWYVTPSVAEIQNRLQMKRPAIHAQFVNFLIAQGDADAVAEAALPLVETSSEDNTESLLGICDWLIERKRPGLALPIWNGLAARRRISYAPLQAGSPDAVTNGRFSKSPISHGFDWRMKTVEGVSSFLNANPNALGFEFSGEEPDSFTLMEQVVPVQGGKNYALAIAYETSGIAPGSGIEWSMTDAQSGALLAKTASLSAEHGGEAYACTTVPDGVAFIDLSLFYQRQAGTVRPEGKLTLKAVRLSTDCSDKKISTSRSDSPAL
jgi:tetratricopeptide (TPR) repeat protein